MIQASVFFSVQYSREIVSKMCAKSKAGILSYVLFSDRSFRLRWQLVLFFRSRFGETRWTRSGSSTSWQAEGRRKGCWRSHWRSRRRTPRWASSPWKFMFSHQRLVFLFREISCCSVKVFFEKTKNSPDDGNGYCFFKN